MNELPPDYELIRISRISGISLRIVRYYLSGYNVPYWIARRIDEAI